MPTAMITALVSCSNAIRAMPLAKMSSAHPRARQGSYPWPTVNLRRHVFVGIRYGIGDNFCRQQLEIPLVTALCPLITNDVNISPYFGKVMLKSGDHNPLVAGSSPACPTNRPYCEPGAN